jgi:hypothetical protein
VFDTPLDALPAWLGVAAASLAALGVAVSLPVAPPPDADAAAATIDAVAASEADAVSTHRTRARSVRIAREGIALRSDRGTVRAGFAFGPVTPVREETPLYRVLLGAAPATEFESPDAFARAVAAARDRAPVAAETDRLHARNVHWEGVDVTLVGP